MKQNNLPRLWPYLKTQRKKIALAVVCMVVSGGANSALFFLLKDALNQILAPGNARGLQHLNFFILVVVVMGIVSAITDYGQTYLMQSVGQRALTRLRSNLFAHFQSLSVGFFEKRRTGELMSRMTNDLNSLQGIMTTAVITSVRAPIETIGALVFMFYTNWQLSLLLMLILPPTAVLVKHAGKKIRTSTSQLQKQMGELTNYLQEKMSSMRLIQTFGTSPYEIAQFETVNEESYRRAMKPIRVRAALAPSIEFVGLLGILLALWVGARSSTEPGALLVFMLAGRKVSMSLKSLAGLSTMFKSAEAAADRLFEMLDTQPEVRDVPAAIDLRQREVKGHLVFDNVRFSYNGQDDVLHGVSFEIKPGEVVALAGLSGSGKTTISNLVPRLYDPTGGRVLIDGLDFRDVALLSLRSYIGAVPQETTLFHGTIRENIAYGKPDATFEEVVEAARQANADSFIREQPDGYETHIGERGGSLAGGQRQRIAIARALLRDPKILILDEATSALDAENESLVQQALSTLMQGRTTLIIAHRFSTIRNANRILVMEKGHIAETGTHDELLKRGGIYYRLYQMQTFAARAERQEDKNENLAPQIEAADDGAWQTVVGA